MCVRTVNVNGTGEQIACKDLPTPREAETLRKYDSESRVHALYCLLSVPIAVPYSYISSFCVSICPSIRNQICPFYKGAKKKKAINDHY